MAAISQIRDKELRPVRWWLMAVAAMIVAMVMVGGATRLTESGLSIVEWKPVTGALPPLTDAHWHEAFEAYKKIPQYRELNHGMSLAEFKTIFWWEWSHRLLGRTIGMVFLLPFLFFLWRGMVPSQLKKPLWVIFALGGLQGFVGWWMVASGLTHRVEVSQYRLAVHLMLALIIFAAVVWVIRRMSAGATGLASMRLRVTSWVLLGLTFLQIYFGALVAGLRAGRVFNTWPDIDGAFIPSASRLFFEDPWWRNMFDNALTVQFQHRMTAYLLFAVAIWHALDTLLARAERSVVNGALWLVAAIAVQAVLGILTLLHQVPIDLALAHQAVAIVVLTLALLQVERMKGRDVSTASRPLDLAIGKAV
ncbi:heme A synthase [Rhodopseudomonas boonkerdii]|uniref:COX15/CtaA family protein n=1 Tax=Rhodopseudomonas boonkerdii TaxID=475937 RepID=UPI001E2E100B|nr:COX15/CtaA family protein [Rhodopseudomonas boonkerdii]UGV26449.1 heme A synthase [Rhodopseudomonas boonkerdii]